MAENYMKILSRTVFGSWQKTLSEGCVRFKAAKWQGAWWAWISVIQDPFWKRLQGSLCCKWCRFCPRRWCGDWCKLLDDFSKILAAYCMQACAFHKIYTGVFVMTWICNLLISYLKGIDPSTNLMGGRWFVVDVLGMFWTCTDLHFKIHL